MDQLTDNDKHRPLKERFEDKIFYSPDGCWYWLGHVCKDGYGQITIRTDDNRYTSKAHRIAYQICKGDIPKGMYVLHSCDNPRCVNPDHLSVGTQKDNIKDMFQKGRSRSQRRRLNSLKK